jgi:hypothetical protein
MVRRAPARRRPRKAKPGTKGLSPAECRLEQPTGAAAEAAEAIAKAGGCVVGSYQGAARWSSGSLARRNKLLGLDPGDGGQSDFGLCANRFLIGI